MRLLQCSFHLLQIDKTPTGFGEISVYLRCKCHTSKLSNVEPLTISSGHACQFLAVSECYGAVYIYLDENKTKFDA